MPRPESKNRARRSRQQRLTNLPRSTSRSLSIEKENDKISTKPSFFTSTPLSSSVASSMFNSSIMSPISTNIQTPLIQREHSMSISPSIARVSSIKQKTNEERVGPSSKKIQTYAQQSHLLHHNDEHDFYQLIHNNLLLELMRNTICQSCFENWNGTMRLTKREGTNRLFNLSIFLAYCFRFILFNGIWMPVF